MVCALGREDGTIIEQVSIPTTTPEETIPKITAYFKDKGIEALGIGAFGPVGVDPKADNYGYILETPKLAWRNKDLLGGLKKELNVPMGIDTDVNGSCLGEVTYGCAKGLDSVVYITIGTRRWCWCMGKRRTSSRYAPSGRWTYPVKPSSGR